MDNATKRQLKKPDQFVAITEGGIHWADEHRQKVIIAAALFVVVILAAVGGYTLFERRSAAAATAFGAAMQTYQTPLVSATQPTPPGMKTFPNAVARASAANAQFLQVVHQYGLTGPGKLALYFAGVSAIEAGQPAPAEQDLQKVASSWDSELAASAKLALAELYQQTNRDPQAIDLYNQLAKGHAATVPPGLAQIQLAELYQAEGKTEKAREIYATLKDKDKDTKGKPGAAAEIATQKLNPKSAQQPGPDGPE